MKSETWLISSSGFTFAREKQWQNPKNIRIVTLGNERGEIAINHSLLITLFQFGLHSLVIYVLNFKKRQKIIHYVLQVSSTYLYRGQILSNGTKPKNP